MKPTDFGVIAYDINKNKIFIVHKKPEHFMRKFQGFGISNNVLTQLLEKQVKNILFIYEGKSVKKYLCELQQFVDSSKTHTFNEDDLQKFVSTKEMKEYDN